MFKDTSRYANLPLKLHTNANGEQVSYVARRFLPRPETLQTAGYQDVGLSDRLDHIAHRAYGDPEQFWRVVDATLDFDPPRLTDTPGTRLRIPMVIPE
jgi:hypothetical protein